MVVTVRSLGLGGGTEKDGETDVGRLGPIREKETRILTMTSFELHVHPTPVGFKIQNWMKETESSRN